MSQHIREPLYVIDVSNNKRAYVQRYQYKDHPIRPGVSLETGYSERLSTEQAQQVFEECLAQRVIPTVVVLFHGNSAGHFVGLNFGPRAAAWNSDEAGMRRRLDAVHKKLRLPVLDSVLYDQEHNEKDAGETGAGLREAMAKEMTTQNVPLDNTEDDNKHSRMVAPTVDLSTNVNHTPLFTAILNSNPIKSVNTVYLAQLDAINHKAFIRWKVGVKHRFQFPKDFHRGHGFGEISDWLIHNLEALEEMLAALPYPELWVWRLPDKSVMKLGCLIAYRLQLKELRDIADRQLLKASDADELQQWIQRCSDQATASSMAMADSPRHWDWLHSKVAGTSRRGRPVHFDKEHWSILHVISLASPGWRWSEAAATHPTCRLAWYCRHPYVVRLCDGIAKERLWGSLVKLPAGQFGSADVQAISSLPLETGSAPNRS
jgi:hypothetical protein